MERRNNFSSNNSGPRSPRPASDGPREMSTATCSKCGKETQVPFKPTEGRPVYCRDCFTPRPRF